MWPKANLSTEILPHGAKHITVLDPESGNKLAVYVETEEAQNKSGAERLLTTYEYDQNDRLIRVLPPSFYSDTKTNTLFVASATFEELNTWDSFIVNKHATRIKYNDVGQISEKISPDTAKQVKLFVYSIFF